MNAGTGDRATQRAANGHPAPYGVRYRRSATSTTGGPALLDEKFNEQVRGDSTERHQRGDRVAQMLSQEGDHLTADLQVGHVPVEIDPVPTRQNQTHLPIEHLRRDRMLFLRFARVGAALRSTGPADKTVSGGLFAQALLMGESARMLPRRAPGPRITLEWAFP